MPSRSVHTVAAQSSGPSATSTCWRHSPSRPTKTASTTTPEPSYFVRDKLNQRYAQTKVSSREVAVLLDFTVIRADVVPAFRCNGGGFVIPNGRKGWTSTNPPYHTQLINARDVGLGSRLKPVIRLLKFWNIQNGGHLRSFHVKLMVWRMWQKATSLPVYSNAVMQSIGSMRGWLKSTFDDPWDGGGHIDDYLSSDTRAKVIRMLDQDAKASVEAEVPQGGQG